MREYLTYAANASLGGLSPFLTYSRLSVNGELFGFYLCIEAYDDSFVERNTNSDETVLYKAVSENCTLLTRDNGSGFDVQYGQDEGNANIKTLIEILNKTTSENKENLEAVLNIDSVLKAIAVNTVMGNYDSYCGSKDSLTNYFAEFEKTLSEIAASIRADVEKDPSAFYTAAEFESNIIASGTDLSQVQNTPNFGKGGGQQRPNGIGIGGMINSKAVSIVDYIVQRIANIKAQ